MSATIFNGQAQPIKFKVTATEDIVTEDLATKDTTAKDTTDKDTTAKDTTAKKKAIKDSEDQTDAGKLVGDEAKLKVAEWMTKLDATKLVWHDLQIKGGQEECIYLASHVQGDGDRKPVYLAWVLNGTTHQAHLVYHDGVKMKASAWQSKTATMEWCWPWNLTNVAQRQMRDVFRMLGKTFFMHKYPNLDGSFDATECRKIEFWLKQIDKGQKKQERYTGGRSIQETTKLSPNLVSEVLKEAGHLDVDQIRRAVEEPRFLQLKQTPFRGHIFKHSLISTSSEVEFRQTLGTLNRLLWLTNPHWDARTALQVPCRLSKWVSFLYDTRNAVFPWEYGAYCQILSALRDIGLSVNGGLSELVKMKRAAVRETKLEDDTISRIPWSKFHVEDRESAEKWVDVPRPGSESSGSALPEIYAKLCNEKKQLIARPSTNMNIRAKRMIEAPTQYDKKVRCHELLHNGVRVGVEYLTTRFLREIQDSVVTSAHLDTQKAVTKEPNDGKTVQRSTSLRTYCNPYYIISLFSNMELEEVQEWMAKYKTFNDSPVGFPRHSLNFVYAVEQEEIRDPSRKLSRHGDW